MPEKRRVCVAMNMDWPLKRYYEPFAGIQKFAEEQGDWELIWDHYPEVAIKKKKNKCYDGIIGRITEDSYANAQTYNIPLVNLWRHCPLENIPSVFMNEISAGEAVAKYLLRNGFRTIINIDIKGLPTSKDFYAGIERGVKNYQCNLEQHLLSLDFSSSAEEWERAQDLIEACSQYWKPPLAIASSSSNLGAMISTKCQDLGFKIPDDIALIVSENDSTYCEKIHPHITSLETFHGKQGYEAAKMLNNLMQGEKLKSNVVWIEPGSIIPRESTDTYAVDDEIVKVALRFIVENSHKNIQVNDIVDQVPVTRRSLERRFLSAIGHSLLDEIHRLQVLSLKRMLLESDDKINKLVNKAGFSSPLHMRRIFLKNTGMTPSEYRSEYKN